MPLRPVPWPLSGGIDGAGGAENLVELARADVYVGSSARTGIVEPGDLEVSELPIPGPFVRVIGGTGVVKSRYPGVFGQSYVVQEQSYEDVPVQATGSGGAVRKYVYIIIQDTQYNGQSPTDPAVGPYNWYEVTANLPTFTPYLLLATIDQPDDTATIKNEMIADRRKVTEPIVGNAVYSRPRLTSDDDPRHNYCNAKWDHGTDGQWFGELFPGGWGSPNMAEIEIPDDATHMSLQSIWASVRCESNKNSWGLFWVEYGDEYRGNGWGDGRNLEYVTQTQSFNTTGTQGAYNTNWILIDQKPIPAELRGKTIQFAFKAGLSEGADLNGVFMNSQSSMGLTLTFSKQPTSAHSIQG